MQYEKPMVMFVDKVDPRVYAWKLSRPWITEEQINLVDLEKMGG
jgi:hypothetical protein